KSSAAFPSCVTFKPPERLLSFRCSAGITSQMGSIMPNLVTIAIIGRTVNIYGWLGQEKKCLN
ncbi:MAG: hypothetical protein PUP91_31600, partial [Rhizonema sp. PD37]|nr:hypothetical protein [Rhizonema sp. PD37]